VIAFRSGPSRVRTLGISLLCAAWATRAIAAEDIDDRWIPSLALGFDVQVESDASATVSSALRGTVSDDQEFLTAVPAVDLELMTPVLVHAAGDPRLFAVGEWNFGWLVADEERPIVTEGTVGGPVLIPPRCQPGNPTRCIEEDLSLVEGMGSRLDATIENGFTVGAGVAFEVPVFDSFTFLLKPSFLYHQEEVDLEGVIKDPFLVIGSSPPNDNVASFTEIRGSDTAMFHALGGRLAFEVQIARTGPVDVLMYLRGQMFWWLDPETSFDASNGTDSARFDFSRNDFVGGGGLGLRVRWLGP
jgi:hypothetical protein